MTDDESFGKIKVTIPSFSVEIDAKKQYYPEQTTLEECIEIEKKNAQEMGSENYIVEVLPYEEQGFPELIFEPIFQNEG